MCSAFAFPASFDGSGSGWAAAVGGDRGADFSEIKSTPPTFTHTYTITDHVR